MIGGFEAVLISPSAYAAHPGPRRDRRRRRRTNRSRQCRCRPPAHVAAPHVAVDEHRSPLAGLFPDPVVGQLQQRVVWRRRHDAVCLVRRPPGELTQCGMTVSFSLAAAAWNTVAQRRCHRPIVDLVGRTPNRKSVLDRAEPRVPSQSRPASRSRAGVTMGGNALSRAAPSPRSPPRRVFHHGAPREQPRRGTACSAANRECRGRGRKLRRCGSPSAEYGIANGPVVLDAQPPRAPAIMQSLHATSAPGAYVGGRPDHRADSYGELRHSAPHPTQVERSSVSDVQ